MKKYYFLIVVIYFAFYYGLFAQNSPSVHGRIQYDVEAIKRVTDTAWLVGNEFRRVHLSVGGALAPRLHYKIEINFAHGKIGFRDVYLKYSHPEWGTFGIGSMAEPTGLAMATSSKYIPLAERPMLTSLQNFRWGSGLHYSNYTLLAPVAIQLALTGNGKNGEGFLDKHLEKGLNFTARSFAAFPLGAGKSGYLLHLGLNMASRPAADLHFRPGNHLGEKYSYVFPGAKRRMVWGGETALLLKSFSLRGEAKAQIMSAAGGETYRMNGMYLTAGLLLTGEAYAYKKGGFSRIKPARPVTEGGGGAWEVLARFSQMNANATVQTANPLMPGKVTNLSLGLNWYPHAHVRLMYTYNLTRDGLSTGPVHAHILRVQVDF